MVTMTLRYYGGPYDGQIAAIHEQQFQNGRGLPVPMFDRAHEAYYTGWYRLALLDGDFVLTWEEPECPVYT